MRLKQFDFSRDVIGQYPLSRKRQSHLSFQKKSDNLNFLTFSIKTQKIQIFKRFTRINRKKDLAEKISTRSFINFVCLNFYNPGCPE